MCTEAQAILSALKHDMHWLLEESNANPSQFAPHAEQLYSLMNIMQLVTSRFARVCNDNNKTDPEYERALAVLRVTFGLQSTVREEDHV